MITSLALVLTTLAGIILIIVIKGAPALTLSMLIETPKGAITSVNPGVSPTPSWAPFTSPSGPRSSPSS